MKVNLQSANMWSTISSTTSAVVNGHKYNIGYYLSDGIYPKWATFVKTIRLPQGPKAKLFTERQESVRKDIERAFGVLQARFVIVRGPARHLEKGELGMIMKACVILHNMIVEDERDSNGLAYDYKHVMVPPQSPMSNDTIIHAIQHIFAEYSRFKTLSNMHTSNRT